MLENKGENRVASEEVQVNIYVECFCDSVASRCALCWDNQGWGHRSDVQDSQDDFGFTLFGILVPRSVHCADTINQETTYLACKTVVSAALPHFWRDDVSVCTV